MQSKVIGLLAGAAMSALGAASASAQDLVIFWAE